MKEGWEYKKLGDVIDHLRTGLNPRTHFKLNTPDAEGYYITVRELKGFTIKPDEKTDKVNRSAIQRINERSNLKIGDVLFSGTGTIGKTALVSELPENWNIKEGVYAMTPKHSEIDSRYLIYYIGSDFFLRLVNDKAAGTGVRSIPMKELVKLPLSVPPLSEQQSIVDYLDSAFAKMDAMKANAEKSLNEAKALFQASLKEMLEPKEGWEEKKVKDLSLLITKGSSPKWQGNSYVNSEGILFVTSENVREGCLEFNPAKFVDNSFNIKQRRSILKKFDVLVNIVGASIGRAAVFDLDVENANINQAVCLIRLDWDKLLPAYLCFFLNSEHAFKQYVSMVKDTARANLSLENIGSLEICIPPLSEQQSIVATLDSLKSKVDRLQENYEKISQECDALKQAILRQVFE